MLCTLLLKVKMRRVAIILGSALSTGYFDRILAQIIPKAPS